MFDFKLGTETSVPFNESKKMPIKLNKLNAVLLAASILCMLSAIFFFPFVYSENPTGSPFDRISFGQLFMTEDGEIVPRLVNELRLFVMAGIGGFVVSVLFTTLRLIGKSFKGASLLFILSALIGAGTFLLMRAGLSQLISSGATFGISWYFVYGAFIFVALAYFYRKRASEIEIENVDANVH